MENTARNILKNLGVSSLILALVACDTPSAIVDNSSGIEGRSMSGPLCPVQSVELPCPDRPYPTTLLVRSSGGVETTVTTNEQGEFRQNLIPGEYQVIPKNPATLFPRASEQKIAVQKGQFTTVNVTYDTGIR
jgi:hypothetical protein